MLEYRFTQISILKEANIVVVTSNSRLSISKGSAKLWGSILRKNNKIKFRGDQVTSIQVLELLEKGLISLMPEDDEGEEKYFSPKLTHKEMELTDNEDRIYSLLSHFSDQRTAIEKLIKAARLRKVNRPMYNIRHLVQLGLAEIASVDGEQIVRLA